MSNPEERQPGTPGSTPSGARATGATATSRGTGYEPGKGYKPSVGEQGQAPGTEYYPATGRHEVAEAREFRGAVVAFTAVGGALLILSGLLDIAIGITSLSVAHTYVAVPAAGYPYRWGLTGWGWSEIGLGIVVFAVGVCVFLGMAWARYVGAALAIISAVANFMILPFNPIWSIIVVALDAFIIWALLAPRREPGQI
jgi:hypothetical protein